MKSTESSKLALFFSRLKILKRPFFVPLFVGHVVEKLLLHGKTHSCTKKNFSTNSLHDCIYDQLRRSFYRFFLLLC